MRILPFSAAATRSALLLAWVLLIVTGCSSSAPPPTGGDDDEATADDDTPSGSGTKADGGKKADSGKPSSTKTDAGTDPDDDNKPKGTPNTEIVTEPISIDECGDDNPAKVSAEDAKKLKAGGGSAAGMKWLYPYDGTVFPRGMVAPDLMWSGGAGDVAYVHIKSKIFEYWGCVKPTAPGQIALSQDVWDKAGQRSQGKQDIYTVEVSVLSGGKVTGPVTSTFQIAQAAIKGSIYYNTYSSKLVGMATAPADPSMQGGLGGLLGAFGGLGGGGVVLRIPAGGRAEVFGQTDCNGCHSVSADGSRLISQSVANGVYSYGLTTNGPAPMPTMAGQSAVWTAVYPDGSAFLTMSTAIDVARAGVFGGLGGNGSSDATLYDATNGQKLPSVGIPPGALMPAFSPDGSLLVFNDFAADQAHGLALMQYDTTTHTASNYAVIYQEDTEDVRPGWPFALPDNHGVVFIRTKAADFTGGGLGIGGGIVGGADNAPFSELAIADIDSKKVTSLAKANGYKSAADAEKGVTYLPFGDDDLNHNYYPTVSPVASGGYFWVFFDSIRNYGGLGLQRQLWGAAIDISSDGTYTVDPSHPPFYLSGQEAGTGNHRAFAALDACHQDGDSCTSGIDCCGGFCYNDGPVGELAEPMGKCSPMHATCSKRDEKCVVDADCCVPEDGSDPEVCIAGFCAFVPVI
jgi:Tol biopolymer transport system component